MILKIALRNVLSAGVRTWLNTFVLALTMISMILLQGMYNGLFKQMSQNRIEEELGNGQFWHKNYDPFDPMSLEDSHAELTPDLSRAVRKREAVPVLMIAGSIYPQGRIYPAVLRGIPADQSLLKLPFDKLKSNNVKGTVPAIIGKIMAKRTVLETGDVITVRWKNSRGAFNAIDLTIVHIFNGRVPIMDTGQVWLALEDLQKMNLSPNHATIVISSKAIEKDSRDSTWKTKLLDELLADTYALVKTKSVGGSIFYLILMFLAMIAIFDTQALSIFKRRREIGTLMALGMTNRAIAGTFTLEGVLHGFFAAIFTAVAGGPLFWYLQTRGYSMPVPTEQYGMAIGNHLFPYFGWGLILGTFVIVMLILTVVSYLPTRKITKLQPFEALRGK